MNSKLESKIDHKIIGKQLGYYFTDSLIGLNIPFLCEKGAIVIQILKKFIEDKERKRNLILVQSPPLSSSEFMNISGHFFHYKELIYETKSSSVNELTLRPVTCPFHFIYFKQNKHLFSELPIGYFETTTIFRKCKTGEIDGLYRTPCFTIGDSHVICRRDQVLDELISSLDYIIDVSYDLGLLEDLSFVLSSGIDKKMESSEFNNLWDEAIELLSRSLIAKKIKYIENSKVSAFYGPKIDVYFDDGIKKIALFTIQLDFKLASKFGLTFLNEFNKEKNPVIIHRSSMSSYERLLGVLLEKYRGDLPFWLAPVQVKIFVVNESCFSYGVMVKNDIISKGFRTKIELITKSRLSSKIRNEIFEKTHFIVVIGEREESQKNLSVRYYHNNKFESLEIKHFLKKLEYELECKNIYSNLNPSV